MWTKEIARKRLKQGYEIVDVNLATAAAWCDVTLWASRIYGKPI